MRLWNCRLSLNRILALIWAGCLLIPIDQALSSPESCEEFLNPYRQLILQQQNSPELIKEREDSRNRNKLLRIAFTEPLLDFVEAINRLSDSEILEIAGRLQTQSKIIGPVSNLSQAWEKEAWAIGHENYYGRQSRAQGWFTRGMINEVNPHIELIAHYLELISAEPQAYGNVHYGFSKSGTEKLKHISFLSKWDSGLDHTSLNPTDVAVLDFVKSLVTPVNIAYGQESTNRQIRTSQVLMAVVKDVLPSLIRAYETNPDIIHTLARAKGHESQSSAAIRTFTEAMLTLHQSISFLTSSKVQGVDQHSDLLQMLVTSQSRSRGLITSFVMRTPLGVVGPMVTIGFLPISPLVLTNKGLDFRKEFEEDLNFLNRGTPTVCPMAGCSAPGTNTAGLQLLIEAWYRVYKVLYH